MSDTTQVIGPAIDKIFQRMDVLAAKLGIAVKEIWRFSVATKVIRAKRDLAKSALLILLCVPLCGWTIHVMRMTIPHDIHTEIDPYTSSRDYYCDQVQVDKRGNRTTQTGVCINSRYPVTKTEDQGISGLGWALIITGALSAFGALVVTMFSIEGVIDALASAKTAEYDAYQDLLYDWKR